MSQEQLAQLIHEHTDAIAALERRISVHEAIRHLLRVLALEEITLGQALGILAEIVEQWVLHQQAMDALRQIQADEP
jgi:hypothetical protein